MDKSQVSKLLLSYFSQKHILVNHHINSYNEFLRDILPDIISQHFPLKVQSSTNESLIQSVSLSIHKSYFEHPQYSEKNGCRKVMTPKIARLNNHTYSVSLYVDIVVALSVKEGEVIVDVPAKVIKDVLFGKFPIPVKSEYCASHRDIQGECRYDLGGYFIVNGNEKVLVSQEKVAPNLIQVYEAKGNSKYSHSSEVRSCIDNRFAPTKTLAFKIEGKRMNPLIMVSIPHLKKDICFALLFRALGCLSDKDILDYILCHLNDPDIRNQMIHLIQPSLLQSSGITSEYKALEILSENLQSYNQSFNVDMRINYCQTILGRECIPHIGGEVNAKFYYLGLMIYKMLLCRLGVSDPSDRDNYKNKRMETSGTLMGTLTNQCVSRMVKDIRSHLSKEINNGTWTLHNNHNDILTEHNISKVLKGNYIESVLKGALATGNWGMKSNVNKQGVSQVLNRLTFMSTLSHLRRISMPVDSTGKLIDPRKLHNTQYGYICPSETPEGHSIGVVKNFAISCEVTQHSDSTILREKIDPLLTNLNQTLPKDRIHKEGVKVFVNGDWIGYTNNPKEFVDRVRHWKIDLQIHPHSSISWNIFENEIFIFTDRGRCTRPLIRVGSQFQDFDSWKTLLSENDLIEYIDIYECDNILIAPSLKRIEGHTHYEIHPSLMLGVMANCIPFCNHNQSPRNTYQSAMGKQAIGIHSSNAYHRYDTISHILHYPQRPLVNTRMMQHFKFNDLPNGINVVVAIATYGGYNQEDSVLVNQAAIDRGLFNSTMLRTYKDEAKKNQLTGEEDIFCKPNTENLLYRKPFNYDKLESDGFVSKNQYIDSNDIIVGKVMPIKHAEFNYRDCSTSLKTNEKGFIDDNYVSVSSDGYRFCKTRVRTIKIPEIGDKVSSRHGQKGTIGMIYPQEDMPCTKDGIVPDIIMNPHAVPSRMTIAQLIECILGKSCASLGYAGDGTPFEETDVNEIARVLESCGHEGYGNQVLYSGITGEQLKTQIFIGPTYYQRLKHMSGDKIHSRDTGPVVSMTRQPAEGRSSHGGLRFGEMERDCMISHGSAYFLKERMMDVSDKYTIYTCNTCHMICPGNSKRGIYECKRCKNYGDFTKSYIPYSCKLLIQELMTMSLGPRLLQG